MTISQIVGRQLPFLSVLVPLWLCVTMSGWKRSLEVLPAVIVAGVCFAGTQFVVSNFVGPYLPDVLSAVVTIIGLGFFLRVWKPSAVFHFEDEKATGPVTCLYTPWQVVRAWLPYVILAVAVFLWGLDSIKQILNPIGFKFAWPGLNNLVVKTAPIVAKDTPYGATFLFNFGSAAGTAILLSGILSIFIIPNYGFGRAIVCFFKTTYQLRFPILTIAMILGLAYIMNYSGMSASMGLALAGTGALFPFFAPILGWLGVFLTGSDTSSNALFGSLQRDDRRADRRQPGPHRRGELFGWRLRKDDFSPEHFRCNRSQRSGGRRRQHLPVHSCTQCRNGALHLRFDPAPGIRSEMDAALSRT